MKIFLALFIYSILLSITLLTLGINDFQGVETVLKQLLALSPLILIYLFVVRVFLEEWFFRAFLVPRTGVIISSVLFGLLHFGYNSQGEIIGAILLGMVLALSYNQHKKILPNFIAHLLYNLVVVLVMVIQ